MIKILYNIQLSSVQSLSHVRLFATPWTAARQTSLPITNSRSLLKLMSIELVIPSNHFIFCYPLLLLPSIFPNIRVFSNESISHIRWPKFWSFSFSISPSNEYSEQTGLDLLAVQGILKSSSTPQFKSNYNYHKILELHFLPFGEMVLLVILQPHQPPFKHSNTPC